MASPKGYIYIRTHPSYDTCYKLGETHNIPDRESQYVTGELIRGKFKIIYEVKYEQYHYKAQTFGSY